MGQKSRRDTIKGISYLNIAEWLLEAGWSMSLPLGHVRVHVAKQQLANHSASGAVPCCPGVCATDPIGGVAPMVHARFQTHQLQLVQRVVERQAAVEVVALRPVLHAVVFLVPEVLDDGVLVEGFEGGGGEDFAEVPELSQQPVSRFLSVGDQVDRVQAVAGVHGAWDHPRLLQHRERHQPVEPGELQH